MTNPFGSRDSAIRMIFGPVGAELATGATDCPPLAGAAPPPGLLGAQAPSKTMRPARMYASGRGMDIQPPPECSLSQRERGKSPLPLANTDLARTDRGRVLEMLDAGEARVVEGAGLVHQELGRALRIGIERLVG